MSSSAALREWQSVRSDALDDLERDVAVGGQRRGRRWRTEQINAAYVVAIAAQFQGYCRDLHSEAAQAVTSHTPAAVQSLVATALTSGRSLDRGNAFPNKIGEDFGRFGFDLWGLLRARGSSYSMRHDRLEILLIWRNSLAHAAPISGGNRAKVAGTNPTKTHARAWRSNCSVLAEAFDDVVKQELTNALGAAPW